MYAAHSLGGALQLPHPMDMGTVKMIVDVSLVSTAAVLSFILLGGLEGVREGTLFAAFTVGLVIKVLRNLEEQLRIRGG